VSILNSLWDSCCGMILVIGSIVLGTVLMIIRKKRRREK